MIDSIARVRAWLATVRYRTWAVALLLLASVVAASSLMLREFGSPIGNKVTSFSLPDCRGQLVSLNDCQASVVVVAFLGTECPLASLYGSRLAQLADRLASKDVQFIGIDSNQQDSLEEIAEYARSHEIRFPILKDLRAKVADQFGAIRTPEVYVLDRDRIIRYCGRIDDQFAVGLRRPKATQHYLSDAIQATLADKWIWRPRTESSGCRIGRPLIPNAEHEYTYCNQIVRIIQDRCVECHRPGEAAPFSLTSYEDASAWAETIAEVVRERRMPPWHASSEFGEFANDPTLSAKEIDQIASWVEHGAPEGNPSDLPPRREFVEGWRIAPDRVIPMAESAFKVPKKGPVDYQRFVVDPGFEEDKWIHAAECRAGNPAVVHHIHLIAIPPGGDISSLAVRDFIGGMAPGTKPIILPPGMARRIPAGSKLVFEIHYTPTGKDEEDLSYAGLKFADASTVRYEAMGMLAVPSYILIPPFVDDHCIEVKVTVPEDMTLLAMLPHMHLRGKSFRFHATYPNGSTEVLLDVPRYDFDWQHMYELARPKRLPKGTVVNCIAHYDNSENNIANPDPSAIVTQGEQTWDEMMNGYLVVARTRRP